MKFFVICHFFSTVGLFALHVIRHTDAYNDDIVYLPKAYYFVCSICAVVLIFPFIPCLFEEYWHNAYYVLLPTAVVANIIRIWQLNWRIEIWDNGIVYRNMFGIVRSFTIDNNSKIQEVLGACYLLQLGGSRVLVINDALNVRRLVELINSKL